MKKKNLLEKIANLFRKKAVVKEQGLIIERGLPDIPSRTPLVKTGGLDTTEANKRLQDIMAQTQGKRQVVAEASLEKEFAQCFLCKYAIHDPGFNDIKEIVCTLVPTKPVTKKLHESCESHVPKYNNIKIIADKGHLMEYDSEKAGFKVSKDNIPDKAIQEIGEDQWQQ